MEILVFLFFFELALTLDGQSVFLHADFDVFTVQAGDFRFSVPGFCSSLIPVTGRTSCLRSLVVSGLLGTVLKKARPVSRQGSIRVMVMVLSPSNMVFLNECRATNDFVVCMTKNENKI